MTKKFTSVVSDFFLKEKSVHISSLDYMEMPDEKERYNLSKTIGNVNLTEGRYKVKSEVDATVSDFLSMPLP
jgi:hypothetical protein